MHAWYGTLLRKSPVDAPLLIAQAQIVAALYVFMMDFGLKVLSQSMLTDAIREVFLKPDHSEEKKGLVS